MDITRRRIQSDGHCLTFPGRSARHLAGIPPGAGTVTGRLAADLPLSHPGAAAAFPG
ncbi:hypothetical protein ACFOEY_17230 [Paracandidimonas soli]|uniref:hypothetical protein n=1 Tax=Paracandidimonas soli TaxID=1917182 RepID=UPI0036077A12